MLKQPQTKQSVKNGAFICATVLGALLLNVQTKTANAAEKSKWTVLVFLNGHNNLDSFGAGDINEMEKVGSTTDVQIAVQWASLANKVTKRLWVQKDSDPNVVTSPVLNETAPIDMGDHKNLTSFIEWGTAQFPAENTMVIVWNHGSGWRNLKKQDRTSVMKDISSDDISGNSITTKQLGEALTSASKSIGQKISLLGADACLMQMFEVAGELSESVQAYVASQETEPGDGYPYDDFLTSLTSNPDLSPLDAGKALAVAYKNSYSGGSQGSSDTTMSVVDLSKYAAVQDAFKNLAVSLKAASTSTRKAAFDLIKTSVHFYYTDYVDAVNWLTGVSKSKKIKSKKRGDLATAAKGTISAIQDYVWSVENTSHFSAAGGVSVWLPADNYTYTKHLPKYVKMNFDNATDWSGALKKLY